MNYKTYRLNQQNKKAVKIKDGKGTSTIIIDKDVYITLLEVGAKNIRVVYKLCEVPAVYCTLRKHWWNRRTLIHMNSPVTSTKITKGKVHMNLCTLETHNMQATMKSTATSCLLNTVKFISTMGINVETLTKNGEQA